MSSSEKSSNTKYQSDNKNWSRNVESRRYNNNHKSRGIRNNSSANLVAMSVIDTKLIRLKLNQ